MLDVFFFCFFIVILDKIGGNDDINDRMDNPIIEFIQRRLSILKLVKSYV